CSSLAPTFHCMDCLNLQLFCVDCCLAGHLSLPFHRIRKWNGSYFVKVPLKDLGLRIQLGHADKTCP
ncbi:hypothetical protein BYT27DRAFT_7007379, partial [Phlegmacium glaucopus]